MLEVPGEFADGEDIGDPPVERHRELMSHDPP